MQHIVKLQHQKHKKHQGPLWNFHTLLFFIFFFNFLPRIWFLLFFFDFSSHLPLILLILALTPLLLFNSHIHLRPHPTSAAADIHAITIILLCACRNFWIGRLFSAKTHSCHKKSLSLFSILLILFSLVTCFVASSEWIWFPFCKLIYFSLSRICSCCGSFAWFIDTSTEMLDLNAIMGSICNFKYVRLLESGCFVWLCEFCRVLQLFFFERVWRRRRWKWCRGGGDQTSRGGKWTARELGKEEVLGRKGLRTWCCRERQGEGSPFWSLNCYWVEDLVPQLSI